MIATGSEAFMDNTEKFEETLASSLRSQPTTDLDDNMTKSQVLRASAKIGISEEDWRILKIFLVFVFAFLPVALLAVMLFAASCMSAMTNWEFANAFWTSLPAVTGGAAVLTPNTNPQLGYWGAFVMFFCSSVGFLALNIAMGVGAKFIGPFIADRPFLDEEKGIRTAIFALFVICWVLIPMTVFTLSVPLGALMALLEGWAFIDGFWWCVSVQCGGGMALTDATITHYAGMWVASIAVAWSIGVSILSIGLSGAPVVTPLMSAIGMDMKDELFFLIPKGARGSVGSLYSAEQHARQSVLEKLHSASSGGGSAPSSPEPRVV
jgi:hypothetical protein